MAAKKRKKQTNNKLVLYWRGHPRFRVMAAVLAVLLVLTIGYEAVRIADNPIETMLAKEETVREMMELSFFAVRDESYIESKAQGTMIHLLGEGAHAANGEEMAAIFPTNDAADRYVQAAELRKALERYRSLNSTTFSANMRAETLTARMDAIFCDLLAQTAQGDGGAAAELLSDFRDQATMREMVITGNADFSDRINALEASLQKLAVTKPTETLIAPQAGFFCTDTDGYETTLPYDQALYLTPSQIEAAMEVQATPAAENVRGRMVSSYIWYLCSVLPTETVKQKAITEGKNMILILPMTGENSELRVNVAKITINGDKAAVIFSCNTVDLSLLRLRSGQAQLVVKEYTGYRIPDQAIRTNPDAGEDDAQAYGVFVRVGNVVKFKEINSIYIGDGFIVSANPKTDGAEDRHYVSAYDSVVVTNTKGLYNGKVVY